MWCSRARFTLSNPISRFFLNFASSITKDLHSGHRNTHSTGMQWTSAQNAIYSVKAGLFSHIYLSLCLLRFQVTWRMLYALVRISPSACIIHSMNGFIQYIWKINRTNSQPNCSPRYDFIPYEKENIGFNP